METGTFIAILVAFGVGAVLAYIFRPKQQTQDSSFRLVLDQVNELARMMDQKMSESHRHMSQSVQNQFSESQKLIQTINEQMTRELTNVAQGMTASQEASKQVMSIADGLKNLEKVLTHQKQRGALGEASLELILSNILPPTAYSLQYLFSDGEKADAVIKTKDGLIAIDAKFSLDNYNRIQTETDETRKGDLRKEFTADLKKRINETAKYIKPSEGTLPFAFMFIPAEGIYYDLLVNQVADRSLIDYAYNDKHVIIVSPTTFAAYLQSVLYGFRAFKIEESAKDIIKKVELLGRHLAEYEKYMHSLGKSLSTTVNHYNSAHKELKLIDKDVTRITNEAVGIDPITVSRPEIEE